MDEHQRRLFSQMVDEVDRYRSGAIELRTLVQHLQGLMGAADLHDQTLETTSGTTKLRSTANSSCGPRSGRRRELQTTKGSSRLWRTSRRGSVVSWRHPTTPVPDAQI